MKWMTPFAFSTANSNRRATVCCVRNSSSWFSTWIKARTEYARPRLPQNVVAEDATVAAMDRFVRTASVSGPVAETADAEQATPLLDRDRDQFEPLRSNSRRPSGFVTSPRTRPSLIRQAGASSEQLWRWTESGRPCDPFPVLVELLRTRRPKYPHKSQWF